uniref:HMG box domain-containing protein n=1 Tax=Mesocestoides corti TaxID=53468 RepID=A0A5K3EGY3_MESCO
NWLIFPIARLIVAICLVYSLGWLGWLHKRLHRLGIPIDTQTMSRVLKDKNRPKGPMSAYACFVQVIREEHKKKHPGEHIVFSDFSRKCAERWKFRGKIRDEHPDWKVGDIAKELGRRWEECTEKAKYDTLAQQDKQRYEEDMNKYRQGVYVPSKKQTKSDNSAAMVSDAGSGDVTAENGDDDEGGDEGEDE